MPDMRIYCFSETSIRFAMNGGTDILRAEIQHIGEFLVQKLLRAVEELFVPGVKFLSGGLLPLAVQVQRADQPGERLPVAAAEDFAVCFQTKNGVTAFRF